MNRPETTSAISEMVEKYINPHNDPRIYWAKEVTIRLLMLSELIT